MNQTSSCLRSIILSEVFVDEVFQKFLTTAGVWRSVAFLEHVSFEFLEAGLAFFNLRADTAVPRGVTVLHKLRETSVLADGGGDFQSAREGVHAADVRVKQIYRLEAFAATLRVEVHTAGRQAAVFQNGEHRMGRQVNAGGELIRVPTEKLVAGVGVNRTQRIRRARHFKFMLHRMASERGVVRLNVEFEVREQIVFAQEIQARGGIRIV